MQGQGGLAGGFRAVDLGDPTPGQAADAEGDVEAERMPVGMTGMFSVSLDPSRMIEPLPNCLWIWLIALSTLFRRPSLYFFGCSGHELLLLSCSNLTCKKGSTHHIDSRLRGFLLNLPARAVKPAQPVAHLIVVQSPR